MSDNGGTRSLAARFWRNCLYLFGGVVLLTWTMNLICQYWWAIAVVGVRLATSCPARCSASISSARASPSISTVWRHDATARYRG